MRILILGCGSVGGEVATQLAASRPDLQFAVGDCNVAAAEAVATRIGTAARAVRVDVTDCESLRAAMSGADLVFNAVGPFYRSALPVVDAAIEARIDYVDINDDHDVAAQLIVDSTYDRRAAAAGIKVLIGCGSTPGFTNVLARLGADRLDRARAIRLCWIVPFVGGFFSAAVWDHLFHMVDGDVTQFLEGRHQRVPAFGGCRNVSFLPPFGTYPAYYSGHGEPVTLGRFIEGVEEVSIRSYFFPQAGDDLMRALVRLGMGSRERVPGIDVSPLEFLTQYATSAAGQATLTVGTGDEPFGHASQVEVEGERGGDRVRLIFEQHQFMGDEATPAQDPTSFCARLALEAVLRGEVRKTGVLAPEACLDPEPYIREVVRATGMILYEREEVVRAGRFAAGG
ncbi:MAG: saccharopine dehydrogenase NADP-binding domain-containing protein [Candidatus Binatia bacterium]